MLESEKLKGMLKKLIHETENDKISTAEQMIQTMVYELTSTNDGYPTDEGVSSARPSSNS